MKTKYVPYIKSMYCIGRYQRKIFFAYWAKKNEPKIVRLKVNQNYLHLRSLDSLLFGPVTEDGIS